MGSRPNHLQLPSLPYGSGRSGYVSPADLSSPQVGDVPPALSPLDAFALQGRLLAKKFEEESESGRRLSRLPPLTIANEFKKVQPKYYRSASQDGVAAEGSPGDVESGDVQPSQTTPETCLPFRPRSQYPVLHHGEGDESPRGPSSRSLRQPTRALSPVEDVEPYQRKEPAVVHDYFNFPRTSSPEPIGAHIGGVEEPTPLTPQPPLSERPAPGPGNGSMLRVDAAGSRSYPPSNLDRSRSPARANMPWPSGSIRSVPADPSDDVANPTPGGSHPLSYHKNVSVNSAHSRTYPPSSPCPPPARSASPSSDSINLGAPSRAAFNFSRPLSRASRPSFEMRPSLDVPSRQGSSESACTVPSLEALSRQGSGDGPLTPSFVYDAAHTPVSIASEDDFSAQEQSDVPAQSYIYSKYSLPRGRTLPRNSIGALDFMAQQFAWADGSPTERNNARDTSHPGTRPPSPPTSPHTMEPHIKGYTPVGAETRTTALLPERRRSPPRKSSDDRRRPTLDTSPARASQTHRQTASELSPEAHLDKGIECHEQGSLRESTYHLRVAAKAGQPTAMLLYALACRHGWGMRPNQAEGVQWLQKAIDSSSLEIADDQSPGNGGAAPGADPVRAIERKAHKAQFAFGIYELGVSYMNGWGIQQDRALALRCFEVAGSWGDADALAEAGYCYADGIGCKKDLKKAAKFYRGAEAKGVSMAGNSWIYKEKYMDDGDQPSRGRAAKKESSEKTSRQKSRTRSLFGRKRPAG